MKFIYLFMLSACSALMTCGDNSKGWVSCSQSQVNGYKYNIQVNYSAGSNFHTIPTAANDFWTQKQVKSSTFVYPGVHPDYIIQQDYASGAKWFFAITKQYTLTREIAAGEWAAPIKDAFETMNYYKTYQATVNTDYGSLTLEAVPIAINESC
ncbi:hypothetical protein BB560_005853 [Smittium megazygosporum]|uniref:Uncharacterized protein n=1 Tax=Smittium megazygosporum TaxID=133381 RepID=A0A2T9YT63_9FUNG|nr:hypothetical protein BB560_005853 [Smittium megazygosporum]